ncbi:cupin domain-containing protein [Streptomyces sp. E5N91]|uniref:cupin domain-containing protein n=1 Tax=Streptomyces sp. E5N91 TaxID=1851996 RepID=UPI000EF58F85|nr:cupin domain-containing protein [Streptomyces sp. E5N91]
MTSFPSPPPVPQDRQFVLGQHLHLSILASAEETEGRHDISDVKLPPHAGTPLHMHTGYEERIWVVEGALTVWSGADTYTLRSGDFYRVPMNTPHTIKAGEDGARTLAITSPARFAELIRRTGTPAHLATAETEWDMELFQKVTEEFGDVILGPPGATPASLGTTGQA